MKNDLRQQHWILDEILANVVRRIGGILGKGFDDCSYFSILLLHFVFDFFAFLSFALSFSCSLFFLSLYLYVRAHACWPK